MFFPFTPFLRVGNVLVIAPVLQLSKDSSRLLTGDKSLCLAPGDERSTFIKHLKYESTYVHMNTVYS